MLRLRKNCWQSSSVRTACTWDHVWDRSQVTLDCKKLLRVVPEWLQRTLLHLERYNFDLVFSPGDQIVIADALSHAYPLGSGVQTKFTAEIASVSINGENQNYSFSLIIILQPFKTSFHWSVQESRRLKMQIWMSCTSFTLYATLR